jgi:hypothetical protein
MPSQPDQLYNIIIFKWLNVKSGGIGTHLLQPSALLVEPILVQLSSPDDSFFEV